MRTSRLQSTPQAASVAALGVGAAVLLGWTLDIPHLKSVSPGLPAMMPNTALAFVLAGAALRLLRTEGRDLPGRRAGQACALLVALLGITTLGQYLFGWSLGLDQLLFGRGTAIIGAQYPGRMSPPTALNFLVLGLALLLLDVEARAGFRPSDLLALGASLVSLTVLTGYAYGVPSLYGLGSPTQMALHTALTFLVVSFGVLGARPDRGVMAVVTGDTAGGILARRLLLPAIGVPLLLGWLRLLGQRAGLYGMEFGLSVVVAGSIGALAALIWLSARSLTRADLERRWGLEALRTSEEQFRALIEGSIQGTIIHQDAVIRFANAAAARIFGYQRPDDLIGQDYKVLVAPQDRARVEAYRAARRAGEPAPSRYELRSLKKDGTQIWIEALVSLATWAGKPATLATLIDIIERKRAEERQALQFAITRILSESPTLAEAGPKLLEAICERLDWDLGELWLVDAAASLLRRSACWHAPSPDLAEFETAGRDFTFVPGSGLPGRVWAGGKPVWVPDVVADPSFLRGPLAARAGLHGAFAVPLRTATEPIGVMVFFSRETRQPDLTLLAVVADMASQIGQFIQRKRAEEVRGRLSAAVEQTAESVIITTPDGTIVYVNPAFERTTGYPSTEVVGQTPRLLRSGTQPPSFYEHLWQTILGGHVWRGEMVNRRKDGTLLVEEQSITPVRDEHGQIAYFVSVALDVTQRKELEVQLRQAQKMEAIGRLAGGVAHDFNNLLTVITGRAEILLSRLGPDDPLRRDIDLIQKTAERAAALTRQLLAFGRKQVVQPKVLDLNAIVSHMGAMLRRLIGEDIALVVVPAPDLGRVKVDQNQLEQVLLNLAVNARDAMPGGGRLTIETANVELDRAYANRHVGARPGSYVMLAVSDTGAGMDAETQARIFEPFFTTKEVGKGTGLGLATVYGIIKQSGGNIWVYSEPRRGTTFKIYLPRVEEAGDALEPKDAPPELPRGSETVLLAEDEEGVRELAREILEIQGYTVLEARDPDDALLIAQRHAGPIHLLLTDVVMPRMSGRELAGRLAPRRPEMKVLYMSGYSENAIVHNGVLEPGTAYLQKPFTPDALARKVREALDAPRQD